MRLERIEIIRLPGINRDAGFTIDSFDPQTNAIIGPNASGKSSVVRAVRTLVDAGLHQGEDVHVVGVFSSDDGSWQATRVGDRVTWHRDGAPSTAPPLPDPRFLSCYTLRVEDLTTAGEADGEIAERISRDLAGGYDLGAVRSSLAVKTNIGHSEARAFTDAKRQLEAASAALRGLMAEEEKLASWEADLDAARTSQAAVQHQKNALDLVAAGHQLHGIEQRRQQFPGAMHLLHGDERKRLEALRTRISDVERKLDGAQRRFAGAQAQLEASGLEGLTLDRGSLDERLEENKSLQSFEYQVSRSTIELETARRELEAARQELGVPEGAVAPDITPTTISALEDHLRAKRELEAKAATVDEALSALPEPTSDEALDVQALQLARYELMAWLSAPTIIESHRAPLVAVLLVAVAGLSGIGALAYLIDWWYATLAIGVAIGTVFALRTVPTTTTDSDERQRAERSFEKLAATAPVSWCDKDVRSHVNDLDRRIAQGERAKRDAERRSALQDRRRAIESERTEIERTLAGVAASLRFEHAALDASLHRWAQRLKDYGNASAAVVAAEASLAHSVRDAARVRESLLTFLSEYGEGPDAADPDAAGITSRLTTLRDRLEQRSHALTEIAAAEHADQELRQAHQEHLDEVATLLLNAGIPPDAAAPDQILSAHLDRLDDWRALEKERAEGAATIAHLRKLLEHHTGLLTLADEGDAERIREALTRAEDSASTVPDLTQRIARFKAQRTLAEEQRNLEHCREKLQDAKEQLRSRRDEALFAEASAFLIDDVESEHRSESRPAMLQQAEEWFARFTRHAFEIHFDSAAPDGQHFAAVETATGQRRALDELSTATKAQLLLAIRVAFTVVAEDGRTALPFFLDEALTTSDEMRFREVAQSMGLLVRETGRQIVYLAAKGEDAAYWKHASGASCRVIDMAEVRQLGRRTVDPEALVLPDRLVTPAPGDATPEAYAALLHVPAIDPYAESAAIHVFHMLRDDLPLLHRVMSLGSETLGALKSRLSSPVSQSLLGATSVSTLARRIAATEAWHAAAGVGHGRRVDRQALIDCDIVTATFLDRLYAVAMRSNGDAAAILQAIDDREITHFRGRPQLEAWFFEHGYLTDERQLTIGAIEDEMYAQLMDSARDPTEVLDEVRTLRAALDVGIGEAAPTEAVT